MIIPIGHDKQTVRRIPFVSFGIIVLCFLVHIVVINQSDAQNIKVGKKGMEYFTFFQAHPYLEFGKTIKEKFNLDDDRMKPVIEYLQNAAGKQKPDDETITLEQEEFDRLEEQFLEAIDGMPFRKYGFIPVRRNFLNSITYQFLHGGWLHLIFNLYLFYLVGYCLEDAWGKIIFIGFYLFGGIFSAYMYAVHTPEFVGPLIGASGSIAAVMGAFLVRYWHTKIKFVYIFYFIYSGSFKLPAYVALIFWGVIQLLNAGVQQNMMNTYGLKGGGVAYWAHVWGFVFGVGFAYLMKFFKIEEKYITPAFDKKDRYVDERYVHFEKAMALKEQGKTNEAFDTMLTAVQNDPLNYDAGEHLWELGVLLKRQHDAKDHFLKMIEAEIKHGHFDRALFHFRDLKGKFPEATLSLQTKISLLDYFYNHNMPSDANLITEQLVSELKTDSSPGLVIQFFELLIKFKHPKTFEYIQVLEKIGSLDPGVKEKLITRMKTAEGGDLKPSPTQAELHNRGRFLERDNIQVSEEPGDFEELKPQALVKFLNIQRGIPLYFKDNYLAISIQDRKKALLFEKIRMLSVVRVVPADGRSYLVIDLFLDLPDVPKAQVDVIRLLSKNFFPKKIFPQAKNTLDAFKKFLERLFKLSHAKPFPDLESVKLLKLRKFTSEEEYERVVLGR